MLKGAINGALKKWCSRKVVGDWDPFQIQQITLQTDCVEAKLCQGHLIS